MAGEIQNSIAQTNFSLGAMSASSRRLQELRRRMIAGEPGAEQEFNTEVTKFNLAAQAVETAKSNIKSLLDVLSESRSLLA